jgi:hypothetical protein
MKWIKNIFWKYRTGRRFLFHWILDFFNWPEGVRLGFWLGVVHFILFPIDSVYYLWVDNAGIRFNLMTQCVEFEGKQISARLLSDICFSNKILYIRKDFEPPDAEVGIVPGAIGRLGSVTVIESKYLPERTIVVSMDISSGIKTFPKG